MFCWLHVSMTVWWKVQVSIREDWVLTTLCPDFMLGKLISCRPLNNLEMIRTSDYHSPVVGLAYNHEQKRLLELKTILLFLLASNQVLCKGNKQVLYFRGCIFTSSRVSSWNQQRMFYDSNGIWHQTRPFLAGMMLWHSCQQVLLFSYVHKCLTLCIAVTFQFKRFCK